MITVLEQCPSSTSAEQNLVSTTALNIDWYLLGLCSSNWFLWGWQHCFWKYWPDGYGFQRFRHQYIDCLKEVCRVLLTGITETGGGGAASSVAYGGRGGSVASDNNGTQKLDFRKATLGKPSHCHENNCLTFGRHIYLKLLVRAARHSAYHMVVAVATPFLRTKEPLSMSSLKLSLARIWFLITGYRPLTMTPTATGEGNNAVHTASGTDAADIASQNTFTS